MSRTLLHAVVTGAAVLSLSLFFVAYEREGVELGQAVPEGAQSKEPAFLTKLTQDQEADRGQKGKYTRIKDAEKEVIEYVTPSGEPGYQVIWEDAEGKHSIGYGPEAKDRTFFIPTPVIVASST